jgi:4-hydroxy-4-methyl-2-oxoglutarate aldolase
VELTVADDAVARLRRLDTCAVSDALDQLGIPDLVATDSTAVTGPGRIAGRVITVELGPVTATAASRHLCTAAIESGGPGDVIVIAHHGRRDCAGWGGNLSRAAFARGIGGTIVDGASRDVDESREIGYHVYASAVTPRTARGRTQEKTWGEPIDFAGVTVASGDYVIADSTGVVFVGASDVGRVLDAAEAIARREASMAAAIAEGVPVSDVMGRSYETMMKDDPS